jgi:acylphosphatase
MMQKTIAITATGKVQGVCYRKHAQDKAMKLQLTGTVENLKNGSVYIVATGSSEQLQQMIQWCKQGPPGATVEEVITAELTFQNFTGFHINHP